MTLLLLLPFAQQLIPVAEQLSHELPTNWIGLLAMALLSLPGMVAAVASGSTFAQGRRTGRKVDGHIEKVDGLQAGVNSIDAQVTNGGTNLAATVGEIKRMLDVVVENQRTIHDGHIVPLSKNFATLNQGVQDLRGEITALERRFEEQGR